MEVARGPQRLNRLDSSTDESIALPGGYQSLDNSSDDSLPAVSNSMNQSEIGTPSPVDPEVVSPSTAMTLSDSLHGVRTRHLRINNRKG